MSEIKFWMRHYSPATLCLALLLLGWLFCSGVHAATTQERYYAHETVEDEHGVIAPWYRGQNGQCDYRIRLAADTLKRYPWYGPPIAVTAASTVAPTRSSTYCGEGNL